MQKHDGHGVDAQCTLSQSVKSHAIKPSHSVVVKLNIMELSNAQPLAECADVVVRTDSTSGLAVGSRRGLGHLRHVQTSLPVGAATSA